MTDNNKWNELKSVTDLEDLNKASYSNPVVIFKHSIRCSISSMVWARFNNNFEKYSTDKRQFYYLDLINYRDISNRIAEKYDVRHESPQVLVILNGECVNSSSHIGISFDKVKTLIETV